MSTGGSYEETVVARRCDRRSRVRRQQEEQQTKPVDPWAKASDEV